MNFSRNDVLELQRECEDKNAVLYTLNKRHFLIEFSARHVSDSRTEEHYLTIVKHYLTYLKEMKRRPTLNEFFIAFGEYYADLIAAIAIEKAKCTSRFKK